MIIQKIENVIKESLNALGIKNKIEINIEKSKSIAFGDFTSNIALMLSKQLKENPLTIAQKILAKIDLQKFLKIEITNPGFLNFFILPKDHYELFSKIKTEKEAFPEFEDQKELFNVEYVSANPTGDLHVGHARNAVIGDIIIRLLNKTGYKVASEYYVNDAGNQMSKLASSVLIRYKQLFGINVQLPEDSYHGLEIKTVAEVLKEQHGDKFKSIEINDNFDIIDFDTRDYLQVFAGKIMLDKIKSDLMTLGINIETYFSEKELYKNDLIKKAIALLKDYTYIEGGATWFKSTMFGDDKDRVVIKSDGSFTYFAPDIAYHLLKITRPPKRDKLINIWGSDHYSYIVRMKAALKALGYDDVLSVVSIQMVRLLKDGKEFKLSKRTGQSLTLLELVQTIGKDATRWFMASSAPSSHLEFDINVALTENNNNPIYYVQYAHARASNVLLKAKEINFDNLDNIDLLSNNDKARELLNQIHLFKWTILNAKQTFEPNKITNYLLMLAKLFHSYYAAEKIVDLENLVLSKQKLALVFMVKTIIFNALNLLGILAVNKM